MIALSVALGSGCDGLPGEASIEGDVFERIERASRFETLSELLVTTGLDARLHSDPPFTLLAPTNIAFEYMGEGFMASLESPPSREILSRVLRHHVIEGRLAPEDFVDGATLRSIDGSDLLVRRVGPVVQVEGVTVDLTDAIEGEGSVAYPTADVILGALTIRERVELSPSLSTFRGYAAQAGLLDRADALPAATLLAPLNSAIEALGGVGDRLLTLSSTTDIRQRALQLHLLPGVPALIDGQSVTAINDDPLAVRIEAGIRTIGGRRILREEELADGRLLILDGLVLEPLSIAQRLRIEPSALRFWQEIQSRLPEVWERLQDDEEDLTVFVPTDFAYQLRGASLNNALADATNAELNLRVLWSHILEGRILPEDLTEGRELPVIDGTVLSVSRADNEVFLNNRRIGSDLQPQKASNGVFYTFGSFIYPLVDAFDTAILQGYTEHANAARRAGLESVFRMPGVTTFIASNELYLSDPGRLLSNPGPFLRYNTTMEAIPTLGKLSFTALDGAQRTIQIVPCPDGSDPDVPADRDCSPYQFEDETQVYQGGPSFDRTGYLHRLRSLSYPPGF